MAACNRQQWIESFEGQLSILRSHLGARVLATMSNQAWHKHGRSGDDPIKEAEGVVGGARQGEEVGSAASARTARQYQCWCFRWRAMVRA